MDKAISFEDSRQNMLKEIKAHSSVELKSINVSFTQTDIIPFLEDVDRFERESRKSLEESTFEMK